MIGGSWTILIILEPDPVIKIVGKTAVQGNEPVGVGVIDAPALDSGSEVLAKQSRELDGMVAEKHAGKSIARPRGQRQRVYDSGRQRN